MGLNFSGLVILLDGGSTGGSSMAAAGQPKLDSSGSGISSALQVTFDEFYKMMTTPAPPLLEAPVVRNQQLMFYVDSCYLGSCNC